MRPRRTLSCAAILALLLVACDASPGPAPPRDAPPEAADVVEAPVDAPTSPTCTPCPAGQLCAEGRCVDPCAWAAETRAYQGCEFHAVGTLNAGLGRFVPGAAREDFPFSIALTNPWDVPVEVTLDGGSLGVTRRETLAPHGAQTFALPWVRALVEGVDPDAAASVVVRGGAVRVRASAPVAAYQFNPVGFLSLKGCEEERCYAYSNDASLLLPTTALRRQYMVASWPTTRVRPRGATRWQRTSGFVAVVGVADTPTEVTVRLHARTAAGDGIEAGTAGATLRQTLARGDVLQLVSDNRGTCVTPEPDTVRGDIFCQPVAEEDLTGTIVESSGAPVAVFAGHDCALVPHDRYACDHLEEQMPPTESLGRRYVVARTPPVAMEPDLVRVVATRPGTRVTFDPERAHAPVTLAATGDFVEFEQRESFALTATEPVLVAQYLVGGDYDPARLSVGRGDPDLVIVPPADQVRARYAFVAAPGFALSTAVVTVPRGERLWLDDALVRATPAGTVAGFDVLHLPVEPGAHTLISSRPTVRFGLLVSGVAPATSYTYPAGLDLMPIAPPL